MDWRCSGHGIATLHMVPGLHALEQAGAKRSGANIRAAGNAPSCKRLQIEFLGPMPGEEATPWRNRARVKSLTCLHKQEGSAGAHRPKTIDPLLDSSTMIETGCRTATRIHCFWPHASQTAQQ